MINLLTGEIVGDPTDGMVGSMFGDVLKAPPFLRTAFNYDMNAASDASALFCPEPTLTQQHLAEDADINVILRRFGITGELPTDLKVPMEGDYTDVVNDYQSALNVVRAADESFMELPGEVRARFANNPQRLLDFISDPTNLDEARKLGIALPAMVIPKVEPIEVRVMPDPVPGNSST